MSNKYVPFEILAPAAQSELHFGSHLDVHPHDVHVEQRPMRDHNDDLRTEIAPENVDSIILQIQEPPDSLQKREEVEKVDEDELLEVELDTQLDVRVEL